MGDPTQPPAQPPGEKLTKQGVRDLGNNRRPQRPCHHNFAGQSVVVGYQWALDPDYGFEAYREPVYGKRCTWCGEVRR